MANKAEMVRATIEKVTRMLSSKSVEVTQRGIDAFVVHDDRTGEPIRVNIPYVSNEAPDDFVEAIQGFVDHEVAHILFTDFKALAEAGRVGGESLRKLAGCVEDVFIENEMAKRFRGSGNNLEKTGGYVISKFFVPAYAQAKAAADAKRLNQVLLLPALRAWGGHEAWATWMADKWGDFELAADISFARVAIPKIKTSWDTVDLAKRIASAIHQHEEDKKKSKSSGGDDGDGDDDGEGTGDSEDCKAKGKESDQSGGKGESKSTSDKGENEDGEGGTGNKKDKKEDKKDDASKGDAEDDADDGKGDASEDEGDASEEGDDGKGSASEGDADDKEGDNADDGKGSASEGDDADEGDDTGADDGDSDSSDGSAKSSGSDEISDDEGDKGDGDLAELGDGVFESDGITDFMDSVASGDSATSQAMSGVSLDVVKNSSSNEWHVFSTEWDQPYKYEPLDRINETHVTQMTATVDGMVGPLQRSLERMMAAQNRVLYEPGLRRGKINPSSLHRLSAGDDRVFRKRTNVKAVNTAVQILIDISGSMGGPKIKTAMEAGYALSMTMERAKIASRVSGFATANFGHSLRGKQNMAKLDRSEYQEAEDKMDSVGKRFSRYEALTHPIYKDWEDRHDFESRKRFASQIYDTANMGANCDYESVLAAGINLLTRPEPRKILLVLSDGQPSFGGDVSKSIHLLKKSVDDFERAGVEVIGIGIMTDAVKLFYKNHVILNSTQDLPAAVMGEISKILLR